MKRALATTAVTILCLIGAAPAFAASPSQLECEAALGFFDRVNGEVICIYPVVSDPVGQSEKSPQDKSQTVDTQTTETSQGTLNNKPKYDKDESCSGPDNSSSGC